MASHHHPMTQSSELTDKIFNPLSSNSDQHQFSPNNIYRLSSATSMRINQMITKRKSLIFYQFLPINSVRKCMEISLENLFVDIGA